MLGFSVSLWTQKKRVLSAKQNNGSLGPLYPQCRPDVLTLTWVSSLILPSQSTVYFSGMFMTCNQFTLYHEQVMLQSVGSKFPYSHSLMQPPAGSLLSNYSWIVTIITSPIIPSFKNLIIMTTSPVKSPELRTLWPVKCSPSVPQPTPLSASPSWVVMFWKCLGKGPSVPQFLSQQNRKNCHVHRLSYQFLFQINVRSCLPSPCCNCTACVSSLGRSDVFMVLDLCIRNTVSIAV